MVAEVNTGRVPGTRSSPIQFGKFLKIADIKANSKIQFPATYAFSADPCFYFQSDGDLHCLGDCPYWEFYDNPIFRAAGFARFCTIQRDLLTAEEGSFRCQLGHECRWGFQKLIALHEWLISQQQVKTSLPDALSSASGSLGDNAINKSRQSEPGDCTNLPSVNQEVLGEAMQAAAAISRPTVMAEVLPTGICSMGQVSDVGGALKSPEGDLSINNLLPASLPICKVMPVNLPISESGIIQSAGGPMVMTEPIFKVMPANLPINNLKPANLPMFKMLPVNLTLFEMLGANEQEMEHNLGRGVLRRWKGGVGVVPNPCLDIKWCWKSAKPTVKLKKMDALISSSPPASSTQSAHRLLLLFET